MTRITIIPVVISSAMVGLGISSHGDDLMRNLYEMPDDRPIRPVSKRPMTEQERLLHSAGKAGQRFYMIVNFHMDKPCMASVERDGQALMDLLWEAGFRPSATSPQPAQP